MPQLFGGGMITIGDKLSDWTNDWYQDLLKFEQKVKLRHGNCTVVTLGESKHKICNYFKTKTSIKTNEIEVRSRNWRKYLFVSVSKFASSAQFQIRLNTINFSVPETKKLLAAACQLKRIQFMKCVLPSTQTENCQQFIANWKVKEIEFALCEMDLPNYTSFADLLASQKAIDPSTVSIIFQYAPVPEIMVVSKIIRTYKWEAGYSNC